MRRVLHLPEGAPAVSGWGLHQVSPFAGDGAVDGAGDGLALDGDPGDPVGAAAAAAGVIVRNCDVLLAVGDARAEPLAGAIRLANRLELPVLWWGADGAPRLLLSRGWERMQGGPMWGAAALEGLDASVRALLQAPAASAGRDVLAAALPDRRLWRAHHWVMERLWRTQASAGQAPPTAYWAGLFGVSDRLATGYADRYRSSYTLVVGLAALALIAAVLGLGLPHGDGGHDRVHPYWTALPEAGFLVSIALLVRLSTRYGWQKRLIACRLLAELCRKQAALSLLGRSLPASRIARMASGELAWVGWRFAEAVRAAPLPGACWRGRAWWRRGTGRRRSCCRGSMRIMRRGRRRDGSGRTGW